MRYTATAMSRSVLFFKVNGFKRDTLLLTGRAAGVSAAANTRRLRSQRRRRTKSRHLFELDVDQTVESKCHPSVA